MTVSISIGEALSLGRKCLLSRWRLLLSVWLLTGLAGLLVQDLLLPAPAPWNGGNESSLPYYLLIVVTANLLGLLGLFVTARVVGAYAQGGPPNRGVEEIGESLRLFGPFLLTGLISLLRILLVAVGSLPLVLLLGFLLYGAAQGALSETVEQAVIGAPILLFTLFGFARFGWAIYFTILGESGPVTALRKSKSLFANNRNAVWILTAVVLTLPALVTFAPTFLEEAMPRSLFRILRYCNSLWSFTAAGLVALVIARSYEAKEAGTGESDETLPGWGSSR